MMTYREQAELDALERWNVGYASEWDEGIEDENEVQAALEFQAAANGWDVELQQIEADAKVIARWLEEERAQ